MYPDRLRPIGPIEPVLRQESKRQTLITEAYTASVRGSPARLDFKRAKSPDDS